MQQREQQISKIRFVGSCFQPQTVPKQVRVAHCYTKGSIHALIAKVNEIVLLGALRSPSRKMMRRLRLLALVRRGEDATNEDDHKIFVSRLRPIEGDYSFFR